MVRRLRNPTMLAEAWFSFLTILRYEMQESTVQTEQRTCLLGLLGPHATADVPASDAGPVLWSYFQIPAHQVAVQSLNCSLFSSPIPFSAHAVHLDKVLGVFSGNGGARFGRIWLGLLDVATAVPLDTSITQASREFLVQQVNQVNQVGPVNDDSGGIDSEMGSLISKFTGIDGDAIQTILDGVTGNGLSALGGQMNPLDLVERFLTPMRKHIEGSMEDDAVRFHFGRIFDGIADLASAVQQSSSQPPTGDKPTM